MRLLIIILWPLLVASLSVYLVGLGGSVAWYVYSHHPIWDILVSIFTKQIGTPDMVLMNWLLTTEYLFAHFFSFSSFTYLLLLTSLVWWINKPHLQSALTVLASSMICGPSLYIMHLWVNTRYH